jgi:ectoine hydroxylase-related dioxygenase (phytanoyl-CoA dioxygenase family)
VFGREIAPHLVESGLAQNLILSAGDVSAHHPNLIHGSWPNRSGYLRRALAIRYRSAGASTAKENETAPRVWR